MNTTLFTQLLTQLPMTAWESVIAGEALLLVDDLRLETGTVKAPNAIITPKVGTGSDAASLRRESLEHAEDLLYAYYRTHPLTRAGFDHQVNALFERHGAAAFAAPPGHLPRCTLFVDGGEVVAESSGDPRYRYGAYCELTRPMPDTQIEGQVRRWLERGEAHERYLGMNVCRYNC